MLLLLALLVLLLLLSELPLHGLEGILCRHKSLPTLSGFLSLILLHLAAILLPNALQAATCVQIARHLALGLTKLPVSNLLKLTLAAIFWAWLLWLRDVLLCCSCDP